jgi:hypothetical protein
MKRRISRTYRLLCSMQIFKASVSQNIITVQLFKGGHDNKFYDNEVIENIVKRMETHL